MSFQLPTKCCKWRGRPDVSMQVDCSKVEGRQ